MSNEFLNGLQAASNAVAGNVAGPVDILAFLLRKAGMPVPENPIGGSNWMTQKGLMAPVRQGASQVIGETAGLLGPAMVSQFGPQIARGLLKGGENLAAPRTLNPQTGAVVYHGSPHKFDKFDSSKIGTGEGAQAYGHGLYLADNPKVAQAYKEQLSAGAGIGDDDTIARVLLAVGGDKEKAAEELTKRAKYANIPGGKEKLLSLAEKVRGGHDPTGSLYKVDLPDEKIARMLDWDAPLSQQSPEVREAVKSLVQRGKDEAANGPFAMDGVVTNAQRSTQHATANNIDELDGASVLQMLKRVYGNTAETELSKYGLPGIRYLDGSSRTAGQGTRNYVVFPGEEGILKILERNGQGLLGP